MCRAAKSLVAWEVPGLCPWTGMQTLDAEQIKIDAQRVEVCGCGVSSVCRLWRQLCVCCCRLLVQIGRGLRLGTQWTGLQQQCTSNNAPKHVGTCMERLLLGKLRLYSLYGPHHEQGASSSTSSRIL